MYWSYCSLAWTHWGRVTHICVSKLTIIGSDNGLSPGRCQAIIWTNAGILLIGPLGTNLSEILIKIYTFSFNKMHLKMPSGKWRPFCLGLNVLSHQHAPLLNVCPSWFQSSVRPAGCLTPVSLHVHLARLILTGWMLRCVRRVLMVHLQLGLWQHPTMSHV